MKFLFTAFLLFSTYSLFAQNNKNNSDLLEIDNNYSKNTDFSISYYYQVKIDGILSNNINKSIAFIESELNCKNVNFNARNNYFSFYSQAIIEKKTITVFFNNNFKLLDYNTFIEINKKETNNTKSIPGRKILIESYLYPIDFPKFDILEFSEEYIKNYILISKEWFSRYPEFSKNEFNYEK